MVLEGWARRALEHQTDNGTRRMSQQVSATHNPKRQCVPMVGNVSESIQHNVDRDDGCGDSLMRWRRRRLADVFRLESRAHFGIRSHARQQRSAQVTCFHCSVNQLGADCSCVDHGWFVLSLGCHPLLLGPLENRPHGNTRQARPVDAGTEKSLDAPPEQTGPSRSGRRSAQQLDKECTDPSACRVAAQQRSTVRRIAQAVQ